LAQLVEKDLHITRAAVLADDRRPAALELAASFAREFPRHHGVAPEEWTYQSEGDFSEVASRLRQRKEPPEAVLIAGGVRDFIKLRALLEKGGLRAALLFGGEEAGGTALLANRDASQGVYLVTAYVAGNGSPRDQEFIQKYQERFHVA